MMTISELTAEIYPPCVHTKVTTLSTSRRQAVSSFILSTVNGFDSEGIGV